MGVRTEKTNLREQDLLLSLIVINVLCGVRTHGDIA
jgi:hypothetical protein